MAQEYTAGAGQSVVIPVGSAAFSATGSAITATGGGTITGEDVAASSGTTGNGPVVLSSGAGSSVALDGATTITGAGTGVRMENGGLVNLSSGTAININGSNSGSAGIVVINTAVPSGTASSGVNINFDTGVLHTGNIAWVGVSLGGGSGASFDRLTVSGNAEALGFAAADGSNLTLTNSTFVSNMSTENAYGVIWPIGIHAFGFNGKGGGYINGQDTVVNASDTSFTVNSANGAAGWGFLLHGGTFNGERVSLTVGGTSRGFDMQTDSRVNLTDSTVAMTDNGIGALVGENSVLSATRTAFSTSGTAGVGVQAQSGGSITLTDSTVDARGADGFAIRAGNSTGAIKGTVTITVSGGTVTSAGTAIRATSGDARLTLKDGVQVTGGNGILLDVTSTGFATLDGDNGAILNGDMQASVQNTANVTLSGNTQWTGAARNIGAASIGSGSNWTVTGTSDVASLALNDATLAFAAPAGDALFQSSYKTLTVRGDYSGNGGLVILNTRLEDDNSPTDRLVVQGSTSGSSRLAINNSGGLGALTTGNGIKVVEVHGDSAGSFALSNRVAAGLYEYTLNQGSPSVADGNWYLRNTVLVPSDDPTVDSDGAGPIPPGYTPVPNIRPEVPLASALPPLATEYGYALLDTLHERVGELWGNGVAMTSQRPNAAWVRVLGNRGSHDGADRNDTHDFFRNGPQYDYTVEGIQSGVNLYDRETADGTLDRAGLYLGLGRISADVDDIFHDKAGSIDMDAYSLGAYWTHRSPDRWYTDAVLQGTYYSADAHSVRGEHIKPNGWGVLASLEGGYAVPLNERVTLEPQAQMIYQAISLDKTHDAYGVFRFDEDDSLRGRLGLRLSRSWTSEVGGTTRPGSMWVRTNLWHEFQGDSKTTVGTLDGAGDKASVTSSLGGTWGEIGVGVAGPVGKQVNLFGTGSYSHSIDGNGREGWGLRLGISWQF